MKKVMATFILALAIFVSGCSGQNGFNKEGGATDGSLSAVQDKGKISVAITHGYMPMGFLDDNGELVGFRVDFAEKIASELGVEVEFLDVPWDEVFDSVKTGRADIAIASITIRPDRLEEMLFSDPYFNAGQIMLVRDGTDDIAVPQDIVDGGKKLGVQKETTSESAADDLGVDPSLLITYEETDDQIADLISGRIDAVFVDFLEGSIYVKNNPEVVSAGEPFTQEFYGIATKKGNETLIVEINSVIREMKKSGELNTMLDNWIK